MKEHPVASSILKSILTLLPYNLFNPAASVRGSGEMVGHKSLPRHCRKHTLLVDLNSMSQFFGQLPHGAVVKHYAWKMRMDLSTEFKSLPRIFFFWG